jgi:hypothetical protein
MGSPARRVLTNGEPKILTRFRPAGLPITQKQTEMKARYSIVVLAITLMGGGGGLYWHQDAPRRSAFHSLEELNVALQTDDEDRLGNLVLLPIALRDRTPKEQAEFISKALKAEISSDGLRVLRKSAVFGSLTNLFPAESTHWAATAGVSPQDCVAFKVVHEGLQSEVVLFRPRADSKSARAISDFQVIRCNNVSQLAASQNP